MIKYLIMACCLLLAVGCTNTKEINKKEQTFVEYVILNKNSDWQGETWDELTEECFIGNRAIKWFETK